VPDLRVRPRAAATAATAATVAAPAAQPVQPDRPDPAGGLRPGLRRRQPDHRPGPDTTYDDWSCSCDKLESALQLRAAVDELVDAAVVYARERGASWSDVAEVLEVKKQTAHERWAPVEQEWRDGLLDPLRAQPNGRLRYLAVPDAAYDPQRYAASLDAWALKHVGEAQLREWREQRGRWRRARVRVQVRRAASEALLRELGRQQLG
jgi:hypothetical protein